nr:hypothetical protein [Tanacetum cinerariifolium]
MANVPPNDPNVDAAAIVHVPVNPNNAPAQPVGLENGFAPHWIRDNIPNNQNGWIEEGAKEEEEDPEEDLEEEPEDDDDDDMEMDDEAEVIDPYMDDGSNNPPPPNSKDEETHPTSHVIPDATDFMKCSPITFRGNEGAAEMKVMMTEEFCPPEEIQRMDCELWNLRVKEMDISSYTTRFNELVILCPGMVPTERKKVEAYIRGLSKNIKGEVTSSELATLNKAVRTAHPLMEQKVKAIAEKEANNKKRKWENFQGGSSSGCGNSNSNRNNNDYPNNRNYNNNRNNNQNQYRNTNRNHQNNQRQGNVRAMTNVGNKNTNEAGQNVKCNRCEMQHYGNCPNKCNKHRKIRHKARDYWSKVVATGANAQPIETHAMGVERKATLRLIVLQGTTQEEIEPMDKHML